MKIYVNCNASIVGDGTADKPFKTISQAAKIAEAGDTVVVAPGMYRESVNPANGGTYDKRISYISEVERGATISGAEIAKDWTLVKDNVWVLRIPYGYFEGDNPYTTRVYGDWLNAGIVAHIGEVFVNDKSFYEVDSLEKVYSPEYIDLSWDRDFTKHVWYTCVDESNGDTLIYANFQEYDPLKECVEISARTTCFYPSKEHVDYITLSGFVVTKAATQWAPPTAHQTGMIGPHWSKGWIIENCEVSHSKCSGISLGKYKQENNDNKWSKWKYKDGAQTQRDCVMIAQLDGWSKETIGSHIIRNCNIHDCGQTGIVGNLGCVFSIIENNHIHHINNKQNLAGAEIGGIKLHAAIDVILRNNHFHHCTRGVWLDWEAQGTRVTGNLFHDNCLPFDHLMAEGLKPDLGLGEDLFIEISHGPTLVDNNIFLSDRAIKLPTQGVAFVHNLFAGSITAVGTGVKNGAPNLDSTRYTPYHVPHRTEVTGFMSVLHGDIKLYNNVFVQQKLREGMIRYGKSFGPNDPWDDGNMIVGTIPFSGYMTFETWKKEFEGYCGQGSQQTDRYYMPLPVWTKGNSFFNGAKPCDIEEDYYVDNEHEISITLDTNDDGTWSVKSNYAEFLSAHTVDMIDSDVLGIAFEPEERYETPDGETIIFDIDICGNMRKSNIIAGPFA